MFYGWRVVAGAFTTQMFVVGFFTYAASLLVPHLQEEFSVSLEQVMYGMTIGTLFGLVLSPIGGAMVDRLPVRILMVAGSAAFALGLWAMANSSSITAYVWCFGLTMSVTNIFAAMLPAAAVVSRWFTVNRGRALGVATIGTSVGGVLLPLLFEYWLAQGGWRDTLTSLAVCVLIFMVPAAFFLIRGRPEDVGLTAEPDPDTSDTMADVAFSPRDILSTGNFWYIATSLGLVLGAYSGVLANLTPYALEAGMDSGTGATLIMLVAIFGLIGKLLFGMAADRFNLKHALWVAQGLAAIGCTLLAIAGNNFFIMVLGAVSMGLAAGGFLPVWAAIAARLFGLPSYGLAMGLMSPVVTLCVMPSYILVGRLVDTYGQFQYPLMVFMGATIIAMVILLPLRLSQRTEA